MFVLITRKQFYSVYRRQQDILMVFSYFVCCMTGEFHEETRNWNVWKYNDWKTYTVNLLIHVHCKHTTKSFNVISTVPSCHDSVSLFFKVLPFLSATDTQDALCTESQNTDILSFNTYSTTVTEKV